jgi:RNA polymerase sigma-70 factor (ECF subfamily)
LDREIVARARQGDRDAFAALVRLALPGVSRIALLTVRDEDTARDAVQEALVRVWRDLPSLRDLDRFEAWLRRLVVRACIDELRRSRRRLRVEVAITQADHPAIADGSAGLHDRDSLERAFRRLDPVQRSAVVLYYYADLSVTDIGATLGLPVGTVKSTLSRGRDALRAALDADARGGLALGEITP